MPDAVAPAAPPAASTPAAVPAAATPNTPAAAPAQPAPSSQAPAAPAGASTPPAAGPAGASPEAAPKAAAEAPRSLFDDPAVKAAEGKDKPQEPAKAEGEAKEGEKPAEEAKPAVEYKDFELPEGIQAAPEQMTEFKALAAKHALSQDAAQAMVAEGAKLVQQTTEKVYSAWNQQRDAWQAEVKADPEIGGDRFAPTMIGIKQGLSAVLNGKEYDVSVVLPDGTRSTSKLPATEAFLHVLGYTGAANNPIVIRTLAALTRMRSEGGPVTGDAPKTPGKSLAEKLYSSKGT